MRYLCLLLVLALLPAFADAQVGLLRNRRSTSDQLIDMSYVNPQTYEIAEITVSGAETLNQEALIALSGLEVGDRIRIPGEAISTAINKLWSQGIIGDATILVNKVEGDKVYLEIALQERPRLSRIEFTGINRTQKEDLREQINLLGRVVTDAALKNIELTVKKFFIEKGFLNVSTQIVEEQDPSLQNNVRLTVKVDKGSKVKIDQINFVGNDEVSDARLKGKLGKTKEKPRVTLFQDLIGRLVRFRPSDLVEFFSNTKDVEEGDLQDYLATHIKPNIFSSSKFVREQFEEDKAGVIDFYNSKGYRDARIIGDSLYPSEKDNMVNLNIYVEEGQKYYFRNIDWVGNYVYSDSVLSRVLGVEKGDVYDMELIQKKLSFDPTGTDISSLYMDDGYLFFNPQPVEVRIEGDSIDLEMRLNEGPQATIKRIIVNGNDRTKDHVILREIRTLPGEKFSRSKLIRTQREILALGYFNQENFGMQPIPNPADGTVDIEYTVEEQPTDQIELSAGWGGSRNQGGQGFIGTVGLVFNNFSIQNLFRTSSWDPLPVGDGQTLALRMQASGRQFQTYSVTFAEPWLGGKRRNNLSVNLSHSIQRYFARNGFFLDFNNETSRLKVSGITVGLGRQVRWPDDWFVLNSALSYQYYDVFTKLNKEGNPEGYSLLSNLGIQNGSANNITARFTLSRNNIDVPIYPRRGASVSLSANFTPPYSVFDDKNYDNLEPNERYKWIEYHKYMFDLDVFNQVIGKLVLNTKANLGFLGSYGSGRSIGPFERFIVGGDGMSGQAGNFIIGRDIIALRGYENQSIGPVDATGNPVGGVVYNKFAMQLRYPVSLNPAATIYLQAFAEAGNNWASYKEYNPFNLYRSAGLGARIFMPAFGLIGIDWGYGFDDVFFRGQKAGGSHFHFTIGQQIR